MKPRVPHGSEDGRTPRNRIQRRSARKVEFRQVHSAWGRSFPKPVFRALCAEVVAGMSASTRSYYGIARGDETLTHYALSIHVVQDPNVTGHLR